MPSPPSPPSAHPPPRPGSAAAAAPEFATLQDYIAELEREKFDLLQQVQQSAATSHKVEAEHDALVEAHNAQGRQVAELQRQLAKVQQEVGAQQNAMERAARERDAAKAAAQETSMRAKVRYACIHSNQ